MVQPEDRPPPERVSYDRLIKAGLQRFYPDFATWLLGERPLEVAAIDPALPAAAIRYSDKLLDVRLRDGRGVLLHLEFQIEDRPEVRRRMVQYAALALNLFESPEHRGKSFASVVFYLDRKTYHGDAGHIAISGDLGFGLSVRYRVVKLWELDPDTVLRLDVPGLWPFVTLMAGSPEALVVKSRERILGAPDELVSFESKKVLMAIVAAFAERRLPAGSFERLAMEVRKMGESRFFDMLIEEGVEKGLKKGREEGRREGREEGLAKGRQALQRILERRFGPPADVLLRRIDAVGDLDEIERLVEEAALAPTIEAFRAALESVRKDSPALPDPPAH